jgi:ubiquinone/menaquinone biosynthesis C-methylase UbiE
MVNPMILLENVRGFMQSRIVLTGAELDLFTQIHRGIDTATALAEKNQLDNRALTRLMDALAVYGLLDKENDRYRLSPAGEFLSSDHPETALPMVLHMNELWDTWGQLTPTVMEGKNSNRIPVASKNEHALNAFIGAMHVIGKGLSREIAGVLDLSCYHKLLDIGGGSGSYTIAFLEKNPDMRAVIFDLKSVIPLAEARLGETGIKDRVEFVGGDFYNDELPQGCDLALLSAIIHQNSPGQNVALYRKIHRALLPGGTIMIRDHVMDESRTQPPAGAVFAINMLVATEGGATYTFREVKQSLEQSGFENIRQIRHGEKMDCIVTARKPA